MSQGETTKKFLDLFPVKIGENLRLYYENCKFHTFNPLESGKLFQFCTKNIYSHGICLNTRYNKKIYLVYDSISINVFIREEFICRFLMCNSNDFFSYLMKESYDIVSTLFPPRTLPSVLQLLPLPQELHRCNPLTPKCRLSRLEGGREYCGDRYCLHHEVPYKRLTKSCSCSTELGSSDEHINRVPSCITRNSKSCPPQLRSKTNTTSDGEYINLITKEIMSYMRALKINSMYY